MLESTQEIGLWIIFTAMLSLRHILSGKKRGSSQLINIQPRWMGERGDSKRVVTRGIEKQPLNKKGSQIWLGHLGDKPDQGRKEVFHKLKY